MGKKKEKGGEECSGETDESKKCKSGGKEEAREDG